MLPAGKGLAVGNRAPMLDGGVLGAGAGATPAASQHPSAMARGAAPRQAVPRSGGDGSTTPHEHDRLTAASDNFSAVCLLLKGMFFMADLISGE